MRKPKIKLEKKLFNPNPFALTPLEIQEKRQKLLEQLTENLNTNWIRIQSQLAKEQLSRNNPDKWQSNVKGFLGYRK